MLQSLRENYSPLSNAKYSFIQLSELWQRGMNEIAKVSKQQQEDLNPGSLVCKSDVPPQCHRSATAVPQQCHRSATAVPPQCHTSDTAVPPRRHRSATTVPPQCHRSATAAPPQRHRGPKSTVLKLLFYEHTRQNSSYSAICFFKKKSTCQMLFIK